MKSRPMEPNLEPLPLNLCPACGMPSKEPRLRDDLATGDLYCMNHACRVWVFTPSTNGVCQSFVDDDTFGVCASCGKSDSEHPSRTEAGVKP